jgi:hypothetical protein
MTEQSEFEDDSESGDNPPRKIARTDSRGSRVIDGEDKEEEGTERDVNNAGSEAERVA